VSDTGRCWSCESHIDEGDRYCRYCGNGQGQFLQWYYRPLWIAVLTVTALGPLSLLLVWRTPRLSRRGRWIASVIILALSMYLGQQVWHKLRELQSMLVSLS
jgi:hypothetical protein